MYSSGQESVKYTFLTKGTDKPTHMAKEVIVYSIPQESGKCTDLAKELLSVLNLTESPQSPHTQIPTNSRIQPNNIPSISLLITTKPADSTQPHTFKRGQATYKPEHGNHRRFGATCYPHCSDSMSLRNVHSHL